jgi:hypothetical protein
LFELLSLGHSSAQQHRRDCVSSRRKQRMHTKATASSFIHPFHAHCPFIAVHKSISTSSYKLLDTMTDWKEVYCWPCGEQGDNTRDLLAVTGIHPLKIAFNKLYGLFICMHCNTPLDCSPGFKELNTEYIYTHFTSKVHKSFFMKSGVAREFLKNTCSKFYTDNAHADAKDRLTALIKHIQKSDLFLDHPIAGLMT